MTDKRSVGRPTKLNKARQNAICDAFSIGCTLEMAAAYANIQVNTVRNWVEEGQKQAARLEMGEQLTDEEMRFVEFLHATDEAKLQAGIRWQQVVDNASNRDPAWAMRMLQYRFPNDYRDNRSVELTGKDGGDITIKVVYADDRSTPTETT